ncbi:hypothetical protein HRbin11_00173 [bacterium HR11]|nr:hypothetical protein HRbin11_00173 [bacterium HR11]
MPGQALEKRTKAFAVRVIRFVESLSLSRAMESVRVQLIRAATSIGANYREANRAESKKDFLHKVSIVGKEASETFYWLELMDALGLGDSAERMALIQECNESVAIFTRIGRTLKTRLSRSRSRLGLGRGRRKERSSDRGTQTQP